MFVNIFFKFLNKLKQFVNNFLFNIDQILIKYYYFSLINYKFYFFVFLEKRLIYFEIVELENKFKNYYETEKI